MSKTENIQILKPPRLDSFRVTTGNLSERKKRCCTEGERKVLIR